MRRSDGTSAKLRSTGCFAQDGKPIRRNTLLGEMGLPDRVENISNPTASNERRCHWFAAPRMLELLTATPGAVMLNSAEKVGLRAQCLTGESSGLSSRAMPFGGRINTPWRGQR